MIQEPHPYTEMSERQNVTSELLRLGIDAGAEHSLDALKAMLVLARDYKMDINMLLADGATDTAIMEICHRTLRIARPKQE